MSSPNELFPPALLMLQMNYALQILGYIKRRGDTDMIAEGDVVMGHMQRFRQCLGPNLRLYYDILRPVINILMRYPGVEEQASISGFYENQRHQILNNLKSTLREMEGQKDLMDYLGSMLVQVVPAVLPPDPD